ncbi:MAG: hypothetical protein Ta2D_12670 [Rickettsiales bacterium]|nr:MAG: hypothetical protein Ta2D_12670 [Rickettsiales bacterium]
MLLDERLFKSSFLSIIVLLKNIRKLTEKEILKKEEKIEGTNLILVESNEYINKNISLIDKETKEKIKNIEKKIDLFFKNKIEIDEELLIETIDIFGILLLEFERLIKKSIGKLNLEEIKLLNKKGVFLDSVMAKRLDELSYKLKSIFLEVVNN